MCIRDRICPIERAAGAGSGHGVLLVNEIVWKTNEGTCTSPVSYTHLRAHETVLELVCRLLLEKKTVLIT